MPKLEFGKVSANELPRDAQGNLIIERPQGRIIPVPEGMQFLKLEEVFSSKPPMESRITEQEVFVHQPTAPSQPEIQQTTVPIRATDIPTRMIAGDLKERWHESIDDGGTQKDFIAMIEKEEGMSNIYSPLAQKSPGRFARLTQHLQTRLPSLARSNS